MPSLPSFTGWMAADPSDVARLFVSVGEDGLYRLDGAGSGTVDGGQIRSRRIGSFAHPGPVTVSAGGVVLAAELAGQSLADLRMSRNAGDAWHSVADATYRSWALFPLALTTSPDGDVFIATDGDGLLIGHPAQ